MVRAEYPQTDNCMENAYRVGYGTDDDGVDYQPCIICGRKVRFNRRVQIWLYRDHTAVNIMVSPDEAEDDEDVSMYPVGPDCYRKHPEIHPFCVVTKRGE